MAKKITILKINLQEGFILEDDFIVAAYSHHNKIIISRYSLRNESLPTEFRDYKIHFGITDSFGINFWTANGTKTFSEIAIKLNEHEKVES